MKRRAVLLTVPVLAVAGLAAWRTVGDEPADDSGSAANAIQEIPEVSRGTSLELSGPLLGADAVDADAVNADVAGASTVDVADYRGLVVVLNVWGSWCAPCRAEAPVLRDNATAYADRGVQFLGVNVKDSPSAAKAFERRYGIDYPSLDDSIEGQALLQLRGEVPAAAIPSTLVLDRQGRVAARVLGEITDSTLRALLDAVLAEGDQLQTEDDPGTV